jgi:hypothetical protein
MSDRETREVTTPGNHTVVLNSYLTGKESNELKAIMYADLKINAADAASGKVAISEIPASFILTQEQKALQFLLVSIDGDSIEPFSKLGDLPEADYNAVLAEVQKIRVPLVPKS